jgi:hypothetical protein
MRTFYKGVTGDCYTFFIELYLPLIAARLKRAKASGTMYQRLRTRFKN